MEHVKKEKPFESKFFELPDPGESEPVEEEMKGVGAETPYEGEDGNDPRLSPRLTRLIEEQGVNRYRLRSGDETRKGPLRHHAAKAKLMKLTRGRRHKQSDSCDKENRPINMTARSKENNHSGHLVGETNYVGPDDTTIPSTGCNMDRDEIQLGGPSLIGLLTTRKVTMNMEYTGDSILNNISTQSSCEDVLIEGEEQEVSSDQSTKHRRFTDTTSDKVSNCNLLDLTNIVGFFPGITHVQEQGNQKLAQIIYLDKWEDIGGEEGCIEEWEVIMNRNKECLDKEIHQGIDELRKRMQTRWNREADDLATKFSYNNNMAIMGLEKWIGSHTNLCRMEKRKTRDQQGQQQVRFDMGHGECDINSMADGGERTNSKETLDEGGIRKHWRIWSSKNRKPEKNMPKSKYQFQQEFIPRKLTQDLILINEFNFGTGIGKEILEADKGKLIIFNNPRLRKIKEKEARLLEMAKSINAMSENSKLINSIMGLTRSRLTRFSARMNEAGHVMIDENMIESGMEGGDPTPEPLTFRKISYANKVTGQEDTPGEDLGIFSPSGTMGTDSAKGMQRNGHPNVTVTETSNRFMLLDEDGHEKEGDMGTVRKDTREDIGLVDMNARWARMQERNLNISYSQTLNQDQRIEEKRHVIQKQLPDPEILGVWPKQQLNYFKQLCHLYEYGEGFSWASYVREEELDSDDTNAAINGQHCEEVDSESDATATFMKDDNFIQYQAPSEGVNIVEGVDQVQMDMDIVQAENIGLEINGA
ncbi:hypothetical protein L1987_14052 [Smallanthus sonchifolius]|uniref:Uncharacterized protein n=1 Tax=Smallanthus sonchifolius TaxID=185202 RepID=A0ACB9JI76_9ASTR|nr:hypothetical protein L1987_14052 [Smallanthus sonchifolius]